MTIHASDPFATPEGQRSPIRRLRGKLPSAVTLWTAGGDDGARAGLTVSSAIVVDGDPGRMVGSIDEESDLWAVLSASRRFTVTPLRIEDRLLADRFAGLMPSPGGLFVERDWIEADWGPVLADRPTWLGCRVDAHRPFGWSLLVEATIEHVEFGATFEDPLVHFHGRYRTV